MILAIWNNQPQKLNEMKKIIKYIKFIAPILLIVISIIINLSCQDVMKEAVPNVTGLRYTSPDSIAPIDSVNMGVTIVIQGTGLRDVQIVRFNSIEQELNPNYVTDNNIIVTVPSDFPTEITNQICLITGSDKEYCFDFDIKVPGPGIVDVQYQITGSENPDIINVTGYSFAQIESLTIGTPDQISSGTGTIISSYRVNENYTRLSYDVPVTFNFDQTEIVIVCVAGSDRISIDWEASLTPIAYRISNEYAIVGDTTSILGQNLASIESITFGSVEVTEFWESNDFETLYFIVPEGVTPGQTSVTATNTFGEVSASFRYAETDQMFIDFDDSIVCWDDPTKFDFEIIGSDTNRWGYFRGDIIPSWWDQINVYARCDPPYAIFSDTPDPLNSMAIKFEVNVKNPWSGGGFFEISFIQSVAAAPDGDVVISYFWAPEYSEEVPYVSDGWLTVEIPMSDFTISETYASEFDVTKLQHFRVRFVHDGGQTNTLADMDVNVDNFRLSAIE